MTENAKNDVKQNDQPLPALKTSTGPRSYNNDAVTLIEFFNLLWQSKTQIIAISLIFTISAAFYAFTAQEWWSAKAKVIAPQVTDFAEYRLQVNQFQPVFDLYQKDGTILVSKALDKLVEPESLFKQFIYSFNSLANKKAYLQENKDFQEFLTNNKIQSEDAVNKTLENWFDKINANQTKKRQDDLYSLSFQATSREKSYNMLNGYINYVSSQVYNDNINNLKAIISAKNNELLQTLSIFESQAKSNLEVETQRTQYAFEIAKSAEVNKPIQNLGDQEIFAINMGSDALAAKIKALTSIKNLSVIDPQILQVKAKLTLLEQTKIKENLKFNTFRFLDIVEKPISRDKPKRSVILILAALIGGMFGATIVLIRHTCRNSNKSE